MTPGPKPQQVTPFACDCGDHTWVPIGRGFVTMVSPQDASLLQAKWSVSLSKGKPTSVRRTVRKGGKSTIRLHRAILDLGASEIGDHGNRNPLDNRRPNVRRCTPAQNCQNASLRKDERKHSRFKGVTQNHDKWMARINVGRGTHFLGNFDSERGAAAAYDAAAKKHFGKFAALNFGG